MRISDSAAAWAQSRGISRETLGWEQEERDMELTQARLKEVLVYDPKTGEFKWRISCGRVCLGDIAGCCNAGYRFIGVDGKRYRAHRLAFLYMTGAFPVEHVDHINMISSDNRWANLRFATNAENMSNIKAHKDNKSGLKGVFWRSDRKCWASQIRINGRNTSLGHFDTAEQAYEAYISAAKKHYGDFARWR